MATVTVDDQLYAKLQAAAAACGKSVEEIVADTLARGLPVDPPLPAEYYLGKMDLGLCPGVTWEDVDQMLDEV